MAQIIWTEPALLDLNEIAEYIALDKPDAARRLVKQVFSSVDVLSSPVGRNKLVRATARNSVSGNTPPRQAGNATSRYAWVVLFRPTGVGQTKNADI